MDQDNKRYILKKLMQDALGEEERTALNERDAVKTQMFSQWNNAPDAAYIDRADSMASYTPKSLGQCICKKIFIL